MAVHADLAKIMDKAHEDLPLEQVLDAPVSALSGVSEKDAELLASAFNIKTVRDLGRNKYFRTAATLADLEHHAG